uniref:Lipoprotein n=1 Tax=Heterorhabditis bacteriophora TaxID=37862 RepID=A0A1I7XS25_HETBA
MFKSRELYRALCLAGLLSCKKQFVLCLKSKCLQFSMQFLQCIFSGI